jgi:hypothetical protein
VEAAPLSLRQLAGRVEQLAIAVTCLENAVATVNESVTSEKPGTVKGMLKKLSSKVSPTKPILVPSYTKCILGEFEEIRLRHKLMNGKACTPFTTFRLCRMLSHYHVLNSLLSCVFY